jgi:universal stress protein family protein
MLLMPRDKDLDDAFAHARPALHKAWEAVQASGTSVKLESQTVQGNPADVLVELSRSAEMVCVGWNGDDGSRMLGSTAATVAPSSFCPVAVVRRRHTPLAPGLWIIAALDESPSSHAVLETAMDEARLRKAAVLALTRWPTTTRDADRAGDGQDCARN